MSQFRIKHWVEQIHSFTMILCLIDLDEISTCAIFKALANVVIETSKSALVMDEEVFDAIEHVVNHIPVKGGCSERTVLLDALLADEIYPLLIKQRNGSFGRIIKNYANEISQNTRDRFKRHIDEINDITEKVKELYFFRFFYSKEFCTAFFQEHLDHLSAEQSFILLTEKSLPFDKKCWTKFISTLEEQDAARKSQPGMRTYPDWLVATIEKCMVLRLLGFDVDLASLAPYAHYSPHLSFMVDPESFDYSRVNTEDYMWQNLIYSKEYQPYFVSHKCDVLSDDLRKSFDLGVATEDQQKIVYGILLDQDELQRF